jgi:S-adenosylmethionine hydrolase
MIVLFTDFGADDVYVGQLKAALLAHASAATPIIDLAHSVANFHPRAGAHLLAALQPRFPAGSVFVAVVDPGVGTDRDAAVVHADGKWYVGPDNGLLSVVAMRAAAARTWRIVWRPGGLSASFHGRDLFAPIAASIASGELPLDKVEATAQLHVRLDAGDLPEVIHIDHYGNAMTGLRSPCVPIDAAIALRGRRIPRARTFADAPQGSVFCYENSIGLIEIAANRASAAQLLGIGIGDPLNVLVGGSPPSAAS